LSGYWLQKDLLNLVSNGFQGQAFRDYISLRYSILVVLMPLDAGCGRPVMPLSGWSGAVVQAFCGTCRVLR